MNNPGTDMYYAPPNPVGKTLPIICLAGGLFSIFLALVLCTLGTPNIPVLSKYLQEIPEPWNANLGLVEEIVVLFLIFFGLPLMVGGLFWGSFFRRLLADNPLEGLNNRFVACLIFLVSLPLFLWLQFYVFRCSSFLPDEFAYQYQAKLFASGLTTAPAHPLQEFFQTAFIANHKGHLFSIMPMGYSLFLVPWFWLGCPWLANPVLSSTNVLLAFWAGSQLYDRRTGLMAAMMMSTSLFFLSYIGLYMPHQLSLFLVLAVVSIYLSMERQDQPGWGRCIMLGFLLACIPLVHHVDIFLLAPVIFLLVVRFSKGPNLVRVKIFMVGLFFLGSVISFTLWYNAHTSNSFLTFPIETYMENTNFRGKPGYGIPENGVMLGITSLSELVMCLKRLGRQILKLNFFLFPFAPVLIFIPVFSRERNKSDVLLIACMATMFIAYLFYRPSGGSQIGPRYYYIAIAFFYYLIVRGFFFLHRLGRKRFGRHTAGKIVSLAFILATCYQIGLSAGGLRGEMIIFDRYESAFNVSGFFDKQGIENSIVFISARQKDLERDPDLLYLMVRNQPDFSDTNITARNLDEKNMLVMNHYPLRQYFLYEIDMERFSLNKPMRWKHIRREDYTFP